MAFALQLLARLHSFQTITHQITLGVLALPACLKQRYQQSKWSSGTSRCYFTQANGTFRRCPILYDVV
uniref:Uncharacterized protein n=1 Tax=Arundo donax TaxID=35708 RepID=A0A0A9FES9_ARUDO